MVKSVTFQLDLPPTIGQATGFNFEKFEISWQQSTQWYLAILAFYSGDITINGNEYSFEEKSVIIVPPGSLIKLKRTNDVEKVHYFLHFNAHPDASHPVSLPITSDFSHLGKAFDLMFAIAFDRFLFTKSAVQSTVWSLLWAISTEPNTSAENPVMSRIREFVEQNLARDFSITDLADYVGISHNHLIRVMRDEHGIPPNQYIRQKRMEQACQMLISSPEPIKTIALKVGIPDLQRFNKLVRETFGVSPRELRSRKLVPTNFKDTR